jgi:hypothetical protein
MALIEARPPGEELYHIGRLQDPFAWIEWEFVGKGRFDDPKELRTFRVLYAAEERLAAFLETLQKWRRSLEALAALSQVTPISESDDAPEAEAGVIPADWRLKRAVGTLRLPLNQRWLDLREHETRESLRELMATTLLELGHEDLDLSDVFGRDRRLTQAIALLAHEEGFQGIAYTSRFDANFNCWAIFEGAQFEPVDHAPIVVDDEDLLEAMRRFDLRMPE